MTIKFDVPLSPINKQASKMFWKASWWDRVNWEEKAEIIKFEQKVEINLLVDYSRPPPCDPQKTYQMTNWIGQKIQFKNGSVGIITGFAEEKMKFNSHGAKKYKILVHGKRSYQVLTKNREPSVRRWWCFCEGKMFTLNFMGRGKGRVWFMVGNLPLTKAGEKEFNPVCFGASIHQDHNEQHG